MADATKHNASIAPLYDTYLRAIKYVRNNANAEHATVNNLTAIGLSPSTFVTIAVPATGRKEFGSVVTWKCLAESARTPSSFG